jgi:hypothetical protein
MKGTPTGMMHIITTTEMTVTRECWCGWITTGTVPEPDHHTPLAQREADHRRERAQIEDGTVWSTIPPERRYELYLRRRYRDQTPNEVVINAVWMGGSREVLIWPWTKAGLAQAQAWCDEHHVTWATSHRPVRPDELARYVD